IPSSEDFLRSTPEQTLPDGHTTLSRPRRSGSDLPVKFAQLLADHAPCEGRLHASASRLSEPIGQPTVIQHSSDLCSEFMRIFSEQAIAAIERIETFHRRACGHDWYLHCPRIQHLEPCTAAESNGSDEAPGASQIGSDIVDVPRQREAFRICIPSPLLFCDS